MGPLKIPPNLGIPIEAHNKWMVLLREAQTLVGEDTELQTKAAKGLHLKERHLPVEVLGRIYAHYCNLINKFYDAYLNSIHLQRAEYMLEIVNVLVKRMYELRREMVHLIVNDYIYLDTSLIQNKLTPDQIDIIVPYHYPLECREDSMEQLLQQMWAEAVKRKHAPPKTEKSKVAPSAMFGSDVEMPISEPSDEEIEPEPEPEPSVHTVLPEEFIHARLIQSHERFRRWYMADFRNKCKERQTYYAGKVKQAPIEIKHRAARMIQKIYRQIMQVKRHHVLEVKRDIIIGFTPDPWAPGLKFEEENNKLYERRRNTRLKMKEVLHKVTLREHDRLLFFKKDDQIDDVTDHIREWFREWYYDYGFFPQYPYEVEGGTLMVIRGQFPTVEEQIIADEEYAKATKGKTKDQLKQEKEQAKEDAIVKAEEAKEAAKKAAEMMLKLRSNPLFDPGYIVKTSHHTPHLIEVLQNYRTTWSIFDTFPPERCAEVIYGFMQHLITEELMVHIHKDARKLVDELMRLELKLLIKSQQAMYKRVDWKFPKMKPRPRPKAPAVFKPITVVPELLKKFEELFDMGIISKPTTKLKEVYGDTKYAAYELNIRDPKATFPPPGYGDVKNRLALSCIFGIGLSPGATKHKAVMLLGQPRNGKTFLADAVAGELNAVKINITPEVFSAVAKKPGRLMSLVFQAARVFQPAVIFLKDIERVFATKVPPEQKYLKASSLKGPLKKLLKQLAHEEKVMFIATCTDYKSAKARPMASLFNEIILVPRPDYGSLIMFFQKKLQAIRSMPRNYCTHSMAIMLQGYGFGLIIEVFNKIMSQERIVQLNYKPLQPIEFLEELIERDAEQLTLDDYQEYVDFFVANGGMKKLKEEYEFINKNREIIYEKLAKMEKNKEHKVDW